MEFLKNKVVWVTGGGRGIGKAIAEAFGGEKAGLAISSRTPEELQSVSEVINEKGGRAYPFPCDVSSENEVKNTFDQIEKTLGKIDILINNAGVAKFVPLLETTVEDWDWMMNINLKGAFLCTKTVLPSMIEKREGHIFNVTSVAGTKPFPSAAAYGASKYGLMGLTAVTREEVRKYNVKVTAIIPGAVDTSIWKGIEGDFDHSKMMPPEDIANAVIMACKQTSNTVLEDIILRPVSGDL